MMSSILACHSAGLSVHDISTDIVLGSPAGHLAKSKHVCLLRSFLAQILIRNPGLRIHKQEENHKNMIMEWERILEMRDNTMEKTILLSFAFFFPYQTAAEHCAFDIALSFGGWICARGEVIRVGLWLLVFRKWGMLL